ncbi:MAG TPA: HD domain-containing phosphohydrolase [Solirubrobacteraceae bacterium]|nr:HD domain-containing phosphohydrolase [Solirubrobacteraceae bacterium]
MTVAPASTHRRAAVAAALALLTGSLPVLIVSPHEDFRSPLVYVLAAAAIVSVLGASKWEGSLQISAAFVCFMLAVAFVGPVGAFAVSMAAEIGAWAIQRYRILVLPVNLAAAAVPSMLAGLAFHALAGGHEDGSTGDIAALALVAVGFLALNFVLLRSFVVLVDGGRLREALHHPRELLPSLALTVGLTLAIAGVSARFNLAASLFVVLIIVAFNYMSRLVVIARQRAGQYAALSWGVLSALVRSLDRRDGRTARHSAAVAAFARDIALQCGMSRREAELAHTAGLLHDIGRFALPDRVMERHGTLTEDDWEAIKQHPELGADMLRDLGVYGPVAQIVRAHHERVDGRGYPDRLKGDAIPEVARIVAVAEVYDTLTAKDTYRDRMTSFQAMTELRRVAGRQLDARFVEALATLLTGRGLDYRHADTADFDSELAIHSRIADSVSTDSVAGSGLGATAGDPPAIP